LMSGEEEKALDQFSREVVSTFQKQPAAKTASRKPA